MAHQGRIPGNEKNENSGEEGESENEKNTEFQYVRKLEMSGGWGFLAHPSDRNK